MHVPQWSLPHRRWPSVWPLDELGENPRGSEVGQMTRGLCLTILYHILKIRNRCLFDHGTLTRPALEGALCVAYGDMSHEMVVYILQNYLVLLPVSL
jgi:hypothetical protein